MRPRGALPLVLHQARYDLLAFFRNRQSRFFTLILPILFLVRLRQLLEGAPSSHQPLNARAQTGSGSGIAPRPGPFNSTLQLGATRVVVPAEDDVGRSVRSSPSRAPPFGGTLWRSLNPGVSASAKGSGQPSGGLAALAVPARRKARGAGR